MKFIFFSNNINHSLIIVIKIYFHGSRKLQLCITLTHFTSAFQLRTSPLHYTYALHLCITLMHSTSALHLRTSPLHYTYALHLCIRLTHFTYAIHLLTSLLHINRVCIQMEKNDFTVDELSTRPSRLDEKMSRSQNSRNNLNANLYSHFWFSNGKEIPENGCVWSSWSPFLAKNNGVSKLRLTEARGFTKGQVFNVFRTDPSVKN